MLVKPNHTTNTSTREANRSNFGQREATANERLSTLSADRLPQTRNPLDANQDQRASNEPSQ